MTKKEVFLIIINPKGFKIQILKKISINQKIYNKLHKNMKKLFKQLKTKKKKL